MNRKDITKPRLSYRPFEYPELMDYFNKQQAAHWLPEEVQFGADIFDWENNLSPVERAIIGNTLHGFTQTEIFVGQYWGTKVTRWFPKPEIFSIAYTFAAFECFDDETEILTTNGWVRVDQLTTEDIVAQFCPISDKITYTKPTKLFSYSYGGVMHYYSSEYLDLLVTPNHHMLAIQQQTKTRITSEELANNLTKSSIRCPVSTFSPPNTPQAFKDESEALLVLKLLAKYDKLCWVDGHTRKTKNIKDKLILKKLTQVLERIIDNLQYSDKEIVISHEQLDDWEVLENDLVYILSKGIFSDLFYWSNKIGEEQLGMAHLNLTDERVAELQSVAISNNVTITPTDTNSNTYLFKQQSNVEYPQPQEILYSGKVYCLNVPNSHVVARRNEKVCITGNSIHQKAYNTLSEQLGLVEYNAFETCPTAAAKLNYLLSTPDDRLENIARSLAVYSAFMEGVSLFSSFAILMSFSRRGLLQGVGDIISWSVRDETIHSNCGCHLFNILTGENPHIWNDELQYDIRTSAEAILTLEKAFIDNVFALGDIPGVTKIDLLEFIKYLIDKKLENIGLKPIMSPDLKKATNISEWFIPLIWGDTQTDFFSRRVTQYTKGKFDMDKIDWNKVIVEAPNTEI